MTTVSAISSHPNLGRLRVGFIFSALVINQLVIHLQSLRRKRQPRRTSELTRRREFFSSFFISSFRLHPSSLDFGPPLASNDLLGGAATEC
jgi:hypothetical protein